MTEHDFTICVLFYGDYPDLADRCLESLEKVDQSGRASIRVGLNEVSGEVKEVVDHRLKELTGFDHGKTVYSSDENIHKYPIMRRMIHDPLSPVDTRFTMWFDDDSFVREPYVEGFLDYIAGELQDAHMCGAAYRMRLQGNQADWVKDQPWYQGKAVPPGHLVQFMTGGWWALRTNVLQEHDWPTPDLDHRGGDVMLGELCRQHGYAFSNVLKPVAINAGDDGKNCTSPRRGYDSKPIGYEYEMGTTGKCFLDIEGIKRANLT